MTFTHDELLSAVRAAGGSGEPFTCGAVRDRLGVTTRDREALNRFHRRFRTFQKEAADQIEKVGKNAYRLKRSPATETDNAPALVDVLAAAGAARIVQPIVLHDDGLRPQPPANEAVPRAAAAEHGETTEAEASAATSDAEQAGGAQLSTASHPEPEDEVRLATPNHPEPDDEVLRASPNHPELDGEVLRAAANHPEPEGEVLRAAANHPEPDDEVLLVDAILPELEDDIQPAHSHDAQLAAEFPTRGFADTEAPAHTNATMDARAEAGEVHASHEAVADSTPQASPAPALEPMDASLRRIELDFTIEDLPPEPPAPPKVAAPPVREGSAPFLRAWLERSQRLGRKVADLFSRA